MDLKGKSEDNSVSDQSAQWFLGFSHLEHIESYDSMLHSDDFKILFALYGKFLKDCRTGNSPVSTIWLSYIDIVFIVAEIYLIDQAE